MMRYIEVVSPQEMRVSRMDVPQPGAGEVLVGVLAAGVNRPDLAQRKGLYPPPPGASPVLGLEVAGEVVSAGAGVAWKPGERVCALTNGGGYAEYCVVPAGQCLPWPEGYDALHAAALPENYFTVWANLFFSGILNEGESLLVHGGSGGIGLTALQLAHALGHKVYATAGSAEKCAACVRLGADAAINYRQEDFESRIHELTLGQGVDVILDMVGGAYLARNLNSLAHGGRLVEIAVMQGAKAEINLAQVMTRRLTVTGSTLRPRSREEKAAIASSLKRHVWPILDSGRAKPVIHGVFALEEVAAAHALMESSQHIGKIMLQP